MNNKVEVDLVSSDEFREFVRKQGGRTDDLGIMLFYIGLKDKELNKLGGKFVLGEFINNIKRQMRG